MKRNKKEDILLNTDNDDISMLAEIQTDPAVLVYGFV
jgi:ATP-dependent Lon protease